MSTIRNGTRFEAGTKTSRVVSVLLQLPLILAVGCRQDSKSRSASEGAAEQSAEANPEALPNASDKPSESGNCLKLNEGDNLDEPMSSDSGSEVADDTEAGSSPGSPGDEDIASAGDDCLAGEPKPTNTPSSNPKPDTGGGWNAGPGLEGCAQQGKAWHAVVNGGPGACGDSLVTSFCCTEAEILSQFPAMAAQLSPLFEPIKADGLKLYHCSKKDDRYTFHWAGYLNKSIKYRTVFVEGSPKAANNNIVSCPLITSADIGLPATEMPHSDDTDGGGLSGQDGGGGDDSQEGDDEPSAEQPAMSEAEVQALVAGSLYATWPRDASPQAGMVHGPQQVYFNELLRNSMNSNQAVHPVGSIAIRRIYASLTSPTVKGYAVQVKVAAGTDAKSWLYYEVPDLASPNNKTYGLGPTPCVSCHAVGSKDYIKRNIVP